MRKNSLLRLLFIAFLLSLTVIYSYSQDNKENESKTILDASENELKITGSDSTEDINKETPSFSDSQQALSNPTRGFFKFILALLIVCLLAYVILRFLKKAKVFKINDDPYLKVVSTLKLDPSKTIYIITVGNEAFLVGATDKSINNLGKIENTELIDAMNLNAEKTEQSTKQDFSSILNGFFPNFANNQKRQEKTENDFLSLQRNRLNNLDVKLDESQSIDVEAKK